MVLLVNSHHKAFLELFNCHKTTEENANEFGVCRNQTDATWNILLKLKQTTLMQLGVAKIALIVWSMIFTDGEESYQHWHQESSVRMSYCYIILSSSGTGAVTRPRPATPCPETLVWEVITALGMTNNERRAGNLGKINISKYCF